VAAAADDAPGAAVPDAPDDVAAVEVLAVEPAAGLGTGFTKIACQTYRTMKHRTIANRTRRSI